MKLSAKKIGMGVFSVMVVGVIASTASGVIQRGPCVKGIQCPAIYAPVTCPNGQTYSNACEAYRWACQRNCVPVGGPI